MFSVSRTVVETPGCRIIFVRSGQFSCHLERLHMHKHTDTYTRTCTCAHTCTHRRSRTLCNLGLIQGIPLPVNDTPCIVVAKTSCTHLGYHYPQRTAEHHLRGQAHPEHGDRDAPQWLATHYFRLGIQPKHVEPYAIQWPAAYHLRLRSGDMPGSCMCGCCN